MKPALVYDLVQAGDVWILRMKGTLTIAGGMAILKAAIRGLVEKGSKKILLDFAGVTEIDQSSEIDLGKILANIEKDGGQLKAENAEPQGRWWWKTGLRNLGQYMRLMGILGHSTEEEKALNSFK